MKKIFWIVYSGKKEYKLTDAQYQFMQTENQSKGTTFFWFNDFSISLPHVTSMEKVVEIVNDVPLLPDLSPEEKERANVRLQEIRQKLIKKVSIN